MASEAAGTPGTIGARGARTLPAALPILAFAALLYWLNPVGYVGGGGDDWHYLIAAECWAAQGPCLPHDHWWSRWPLVAPMAAAISLFGESRASVSIVPLAYSAAILIVLAAIAERLAGRAAAVVAGCTLLLTPIFAIQLARPNVDHPELFYLLAALLGWIEAARTGDRRWALLLGASLGFAVLTRETGIVFVAAAVIAFLASPKARRMVLIWAAPAFVVPIAAEMLVYLVSTGDPLHRLHLSAAHARIPSAELANWVDRSRSPLFNPDFIAGWRAANGIEAHWTVKPVLNLITHAEIGLTLFAGPALLLAAGGRRNIWMLLAITCGAAFLFAYAFGIDPKPRMFLPLAAAASLAGGAGAVALWRSRRRSMPLAAGALVVPVALFTFAGTPAIGRGEDEAAHWLAANAASVTLDETARRHLALVAAARALPVDDGARPLRLRFAWSGCAVEAPLQHVALAAPPVARLRGDAAVALCLVPSRG